MPSPGWDSHGADPRFACLVLISVPKDRTFRNDKMEDAVDRNVANPVVSSHCVAMLAPGEEPVPQTKLELIDVKVRELMFHPTGGDSSDSTIYFIFAPVTPGELIRMHRGTCIFGVGELSHRGGLGFISFSVRMTAPSTIPRSYP